MGEAPAPAPAPDPASVSASPTDPAAADGTTTEPEEAAWQVEEAAWQAAASASAALNTRVRRLVVSPVMDRRSPITARAADSSRKVSELRCQGGGVVEKARQCFGAVMSGR